MVEFEENKIYISEDAWSNLISGDSLALYDISATIRAAFQRDATFIIYGKNQTVIRCIKRVSEFEAMMLNIDENRKILGNTGDKI